MSRAPRICTRPGCPNVTPCPVHVVTQQERRFKDPVQARFYGSAQWKQIRALVKAQEPTCRLCHVAPTTTVDHVDGDWTNNARENHRGLCSNCERSHTARQHRRKGTGGGVSKK